MSRPTNTACLVALLLLAVAFGMPANAQDQSQSVTTSGSIFGTLGGSPLWTRYKKDFVGAKGNVIDNVNGGISHSESQGYGMLLAIAADDRQSFEQIYRFASETLAVRSDSLHAWRYTPKARQAVSDTNNASDGDILIAWALFEASQAGWGSRFAEEAKAILADLKPQMKEWPEIGLVLSPGEIGFEHKVTGQIVNLSYWIFPAFERLFQITGEQHWQRLLASGEQLIAQFISQKQGRVPDWILLEKGRVNARLAPEKAPVFGYEAIRIPLYLLMSASGDKDLALAIVKASQTGNGQKLQVVDVDSGKATQSFADVGYGAIASLARCHQNNEPISQALTRTLDKNYYPATLQLLALAAAKQRYASCL